MPPRGYTLPEGLGSATAFGVALNVREQERLNSTKNVIFPQQPPDEGGAGAAAASMYMRTHGSFAPGACGA